MPIQIPSLERTGLQRSTVTALAATPDPYGSVLKPQPNASILIISLVLMIDVWQYRNQLVEAVA
jgi:hypothetical protein